MDKLPDLKISDPIEVKYVSVVDDIPGCPEIRWDGPYSYRCGMGIEECHIHGKFETKLIDIKDKNE